MYLGRVPRRYSERMLVPVTAAMAMASQPSIEFDVSTRFFTMHLLVLSECENADENEAGITPLHSKVTYSQTLVLVSIFANPWKASFVREWKRESISTLFSALHVAIPSKMETRSL
jgi:hypothetical protein